MIIEEAIVFDLLVNVKFQVYAQKETCSEEVNVERSVSRCLQQVGVPSEESVGAPTTSNSHPKLQFVWGTTMYHHGDLPFDVSCLPDVYTQFRKVWYFKLTRVCRFVYLIGNGFCYSRIDSNLRL